MGAVRKMGFTPRFDPLTLEVRKYPLAREGTRKEDLLSRLRKVLAASLVSALMLVMMAAPAFAFHHV